MPDDLLNFFKAFRPVRERSDAHQQLPQAPIPTAAGAPRAAAHPHRFQSPQAPRAAAKRTRTKPTAGGTDRSVGRAF